MRISFQTRVLVPIIGILFSVLGGTWLLVHRHNQEEFQRDATTDLEFADRVLRNFYDIRTRSLILRFRSIASEPRLKAVAQLGDRATMRALLRELISEHHTNATVQYVSADGSLAESFSLHPYHQPDALQAATTTACSQAANTRDSVADLVFTGRSLLNVVGTPVLVNQQVIGVLTLGVPLGQSVLDDLKRLTRCELVIRVAGQAVATTLTQPFDNPGTPSPSSPELQPSLEALGRMEPLTVKGHHFLSTSGQLKTLDPEQKITYELLYSFEEQLTKLHTTQNEIALFGALGILLSSAVVCLIIRGVTQPLRLLHEAAERIGGGDLSSRVKITTQDECSELAMVFNRMARNLETSRQQLEDAKHTLEQRVQERTSELTQEIRRREQIQDMMQEAQGQLLEVSRKAGMAEIATSVLHNVGNILNSLNVSASVLSEQLQKSKTPNLAKAVGLLGEHRHELAHYLKEDPKGRRLPDYLEALSAHLLAERQLLVQEITSLQDHIDHIKRVVIMQQRYAQCSGVTEQVSAESLLEDALRLSVADPVSHSLKIVREYNPVAVLSVDRHKVLQILVNLLNNSVQALESRSEDRRLTLRTMPLTPGRVCIEVEDNGCGIAAENLSSIFQHGFTTKSGGHGFGLHSGALAAIELGGCLNAKSEGPGRGACFSLVLPLSQVAPSQDQAA